MRISCALRTLGLAAGLVACAPAARAGVASATNSTAPDHVLLVGRSGTRADTTLGSFTGVSRDLANNPQNHRLMEFRLFDCAGARVAADQFQPGVGAACATRSVTEFTDEHGVVRFAVVGGGIPGAAASNAPCGQILSDGVLLRTVHVAYLDLDGSGGLGGNDLSLWLSDYGAGQPISRSDFDGDDAVGANDLSLWLEAWARGNSAESASTYCP